MCMLRKFQEYWCKRLHPKNVCEKVYRQPPLRDSLKKGKLRKQDFAMTKQKAALLMAADSIGKRIQYDSQGFLSNRRQVIQIWEVYLFICWGCCFIVLLPFPLLPYLLCIIVCYCIALIWRKMDAKRLRICYLNELFCFLRLLHYVLFFLSNRVPSFSPKILKKL